MAYRKLFLLLVICIKIYSCSTFKEPQIQRGLRGDLMTIKPILVGSPIPIDSFNKYVKPLLDSIGFKY
jgi:hypothetical protein